MKKTETDCNMGFRNTVGLNSFERESHLLVTLGYNTRETYLVLIKPWFCHLDP